MWGKRQHEVRITALLYCCANLTSSVSNFKTERVFKRYESKVVEDEIHILTEFPSYGDSRMLCFEF